MLHPMDSFITYNPFSFTQTDVRLKDEPTRQVQRYILSKEVAHPKSEDQGIQKLNPMKIVKPVTLLQQDKERKGRWTLKEENLYWNFILNSKSLCPQWRETRTDRKRVGYFLQMSNFIKTRSPGQCRSHDQKIRKRIAAGESVIAVRRYKPELEMEGESLSSEIKSTSDESLVQHGNYKDMVDAHSFLNSQQDYNFDLESQASTQAFFAKLSQMMDNDYIKEEPADNVKQEVKTCHDELKAESMEETPEMPVKTEMQGNTNITALTMMMKFLEEKMTGIERHFVKSE